LRMESVEYEPAWSVGANVGNNDARVVAKMIDLCNDYGMDAIEIGHPIAVYMEASEKGWTKPEDGTLAWGDNDNMVALAKNWQARGNWQAVWRRRKPHRRLFWPSRSCHDGKGTGYSGL